jgi:hypothetical protein
MTKAGRNGRLFVDSAEARWVIRFISRYGIVRLANSFRSIWTIIRPLTKVGPVGRSRNGSNPVECMTGSLPLIRTAFGVEPFIAKHQIDMSEFQPVKYKSLPPFLIANFALV